MKVEKIAVFSDTHLYNTKLGVSYLEEIMIRFAPDASCVLHAGDLGVSEALLAFNDLPVHRVLGNTDRPEPGIPISKLVTVGSSRIGLIHGWGIGSEIEIKAREAFIGQSLDVLVYGHSHIPVCHRVGGMLLFNPGSCTDKRQAKHFTFGMLKLGDKITGEIINVDEVNRQFFCTNVPHPGKGRR